MIEIHTIVARIIFILNPVDGDAAWCSRIVDSCWWYPCRRLRSVNTMISGIINTAQWFTMILSTLTLSGESDSRRLIFAMARLTCIKVWRKIAYVSDIIFARIFILKSKSPYPKVDTQPWAIWYWMILSLDQVYLTGVLISTFRILVRSTFRLHTYSHSKPSFTIPVNSHSWAHLPFLSIHIHGLFVSYHTANICL